MQAANLPARPEFLSGRGVATPLNDLVFRQKTLIFKEHDSKTLTGGFVSENEPTDFSHNFPP